MIDGVAMKGTQLIIPFSLQKNILDQLHSNHMGMEKRWLLARESVYWINMNADVQHVVKLCVKCLKYQWTQPQEKALHYEIPHSPWVVVNADVIMINGKTLLPIVDYHSKFPIVK